jgi:DNA topoisomerase I
VASRLGNTPTICRKCYVHPESINSYLEGSLLLEIKSEAESKLRDKIAGLSPEEAAVLASLRARLEEKAVADARGLLGLHCGEAALRL